MTMWTGGPSRERGSAALNAAIATKLYEICTCRGYVDDRDWREAANEVLAEQSRALRRPADAKTAAPPGR
jgi:hypothetical protein